MTATMSPPEAVVRPSSVDEVVEALARAKRDGLGVLPVCSGTRVRAGRGLPGPTAEVGSGSGGARWIALSTERLSGIEIYEPADLTITAGAGTSIAAIADALAVNGQWMPFDPPFVEERSLGGLVADGASGPLWAGYGELRNHVLGANVVTGDGRVLRLGGRVVKNVAGFDLLKPMTGSRGSLGVIVSACVRAFPLPAEDRVLLLEAPDVDGLLDVALAVGTAPVLPVSCVVVADGGRSTRDAARGGVLLVRLHGAPTTVDSDQRTIEAHVGRSFAVAETHAAASLLERARDGAARAGTVLEASARPSRLARLWATVNDLAPDAMVVDAYAGRLRAGLDHVAPDRLRGVAQRVESLGGALAVLRTEDPSLAGLGSRTSDAEALLVERLGRAFDPGGILWPARR